MKRLSCFVFLVVLGVTSAAQAELFVSKNSGSSSSSSSGSNIYIAPNSTSNSDSNTAGTIYNRVDPDSSGPNFVPRQLQARPGYVVDPLLAAKKQDVKDAQNMAARNASQINSALEQARIEREKDIAERQRIWDEQQALKAQAEAAGLDKLKAAAANGAGAQYGSTSGATATAPVRQVYKGSNSTTLYNGTGGRVFGAD